MNSTSAFAPSTTRINLVAARFAVCLASLATSTTVLAAQETFNYTGAAQSFTVPTGITSIQIVAQGGDGKSVFSNDAKGAEVTATLAVTPGEEFDVYVGGAGTAGAGGWNGGGAIPLGSISAGGGGGATDFRPTGGGLAERLLVAGGAGGSRLISVPGGSGGTPTGGDGTGQTNASCTYGGGGGATVALPGAGGTLSAGCGSNWVTGSAGVFGTGGDGATQYAGSGGGGYYGGGGGAGEPGGGNGAGGGGGSSYATASASGVSYALKAGGDQAHGLLSITYADSYTIGGAVSGLAGSTSVTLQNNGGDDLTVNDNIGFTFATPLVANSAYAVTVSTQPTGQVCTVASGSGTATANVTNISISCSADADGDGTPDGGDAFPSDPVENTDTDTDGIGDNGDAGGTGVGIQLTAVPASCAFAGPVVASATSFTGSAPGNAFGTQLNFVLTGCGSPVTVTALFGETLPAGSVAYKVSSSGNWQAIPGAVVAGDRVTYTISDNGPLDDDTVSGQITDPITVVVPGAGSGSAAPVPTLPVGFLLALCGLVGLLAYATHTRLR